MKSLETRFRIEVFHSRCSLQCIACWSVLFAIFTHNSGGEHGGRMRPDYEGTRPGPYLAGHCSLQWIGRVYSRLVRFFGRDKVIVIAQLQETVRWLREASKDEEAAKRLAGRSALLPMLRQQLSEVLESCADLMADGGAHYDGSEVGQLREMLGVRKETERV